MAACIIETMYTIRWCAECAAETPFATFECTDHGGDCVELHCTGCGCGIELGRPALVTPGQTSSAA